MCNNCLRLSQQCRYQDRVIPRPKEGRDGSQHGSEDADEQHSRKSDVRSYSFRSSTVPKAKCEKGQLSERLRIVERKLDDLIGTVHRYAKMIGSV